MSAWNLSELARVAALCWVAILLLHVSGAVAAETVKAQSEGPCHAVTDRGGQRADGRFARRRGVRLTLPENATTGYRWTVDHFDREVVDPAGSEPHYAGGAVGSAGNVTFDFTAKKAGNGEVALKYWRHFEGEGSVVKRFRIRLNAQ